MTAKSAFRFAVGAFLLLASCSRPEAGSQLEEEELAWTPVRAFTRPGDHGVAESKTLDSIASSITDSDWLLITGDSSRRSFGRLRLNGVNSEPEMVAPALWLVPGWTSSSEAMQVGMEVQSSPGPDLRFEVFLLPGFQKRGLDRPGRREFAVRRSRGRWVHALHEQLLVASGFPKHPHLRRQFVAFDFLTHYYILSYWEEGMDSASLHADARAYDPGFRVDSKVRSDLDLVLSFYASRGGVRDSTSHVRHELERSLYKHRPLKPLEDMREFSKHLCVVEDLVVDAIAVLAPNPSDAPTVGLVEENDLLLFALGELEIPGISTGDDEVMNCEPNGGYFFAFAELFLKCGEILREDSKTPPSWVRTAIMAEILFLDSYASPTTVRDLDAYSSTHGPPDIRPSSVGDMILFAVDCVGSKEQIAMRELHESFVGCAIGKDPSTCIRDGPCSSVK